MLSRSLINLARHNLAAIMPQDEDFANLRQAQRLAYYAMFHALCESNAQTLAERIHAHPENKASERTYRALDHSIFTRKRAPEFQKLFSPPIHQFIKIAAELKRKRERADYSPSYTDSRKDVAYDINKAQNAIAAFQAVHIDQRRSLALYLLTTAR